MTAKLRRILMVLCVLVIAACIAWIIVDRAAIARQRNADTALKSMKPGASVLDWLLPSASAEEAEEEAMPVIQEDFKDLLETNADTVAWVTAGERIDYPVVQKDNVYYLYHNFYGEEDSNGCVFLNKLNSIYPRSDVLLLHAHFMRNEGMFGTLPKFAEWDYVQQYPIISFRTIYDEQDVAYVPVAAFHADMDKNNKAYFNLLWLDFDLEEDHQAYIDAIYERSLWTTPIDCNTEDPLLLLITCSYETEDGRFILFCRQLRADETVEDVTEQIQNWNQ